MLGALPGARCATLEIRQVLQRHDVGGVRRMTAVDARPCPFQVHQVQVDRILDDVGRLTVDATAQAAIWSVALPRGFGKSSMLDGVCELSRLLGDVALPIVVRIDACDDIDAVASSILGALSSTVADQQDQWRLDGLKRDIGAHLAGTATDVALAVLGDAVPAGNTIRSVGNAAVEVFRTTQAARELQALARQGVSERDADLVRMIVSEIDDVCTKWRRTKRHRRVPTLVVAVDDADAVQDACFSWLVKLIVEILARPKLKMSVLLLLATTSEIDAAGRAGAVSEAIGGRCPTVLQHTRELGLGEGGLGGLERDELSQLVDVRLDQQLDEATRSLIVERLWPPTPLSVGVAVAQIGEIAAAVGAGQEITAAWLDELPSDQDQLLVGQMDVILRASEFQPCQLAFWAVLAAVDEPADEGAVLAAAHVLVGEQEEVECVATSESPFVVSRTPGPRTSAMIELASPLLEASVRRYVESNRIYGQDQLRTAYLRALIARAAVMVGRRTSAARESWSAPLVQVSRLLPEWVSDDDVRAQRSVSHLGATLVLTGLLARRAGGIDHQVQQLFDCPAGDRNGLWEHVATGAIRQSLAEKSLLAQQSLAALIDAGFALHEEGRSSRSFADFLVELAYGSHDHSDYARTVAVLAVEALVQRDRYTACRVMTMALDADVRRDAADDLEEHFLGSAPDSDVDLWVALARFRLDESGDGARVRGMLRRLVPDVSAAARLFAEAMHQSLDAAEDDSSFEADRELVVGALRRFANGHKAKSAIALAASGWVEPEEQRDLLRRWLFQHAAALRLFVTVMESEDHDRVAQAALSPRMRSQLTAEEIAQITATTATLPVAVASAAPFWLESLDNPAVAATMAAKCTIDDAVFALLLPWFRTASRTAVDVYFERLAPVRAKPGVLALLWETGARPADVWTWLQRAVAGGAADDRTFYAYASALLERARATGRGAYRGKLESALTEAIARVDAIRGVDAALVSSARYDLAVVASSLASELHHRGDEAALAHLQRIRRLLLAYAADSPEAALRLLELRLPARSLSRTLETVVSAHQHDARVLTAALSVAAARGVELPDSLPGIDDVASHHPSSARLVLTAMTDAAEAGNPFPEARVAQFLGRVLPLARVDDRVALAALGVADLLEVDERDLLGPIVLQHVPTSRAAFRAVRRDPERFGGPRVVASALALGARLHPDLLADYCTWYVAQTVALSTYPIAGHGALIRQLGSPRGATIRDLGCLYALHDRDVDGVDLIGMLYRRARDIRFSRERELSARHGRRARPRSLSVKEREELRTIIKRYGVPEALDLVAAGAPADEVKESWLRSARKDPRVLLWLWCAHRTATRSQRETLPAAATIRRMVVTRTLSSSWRFTQTLVDVVAKEPLLSSEVGRLVRTLAEGVIAEVDGNGQSVRSRMITHLVTAAPSLPAGALEAALPAVRQRGGSLGAKDAVPWALAALKATATTPELNGDLRARAEEILAAARLNRAFSVVEFGTAISLLDPVAGWRLWQSQGAALLKDERRRRTWVGPTSSGALVCALRLFTARGYDSRREARDQAVREFRGAVKDGRADAPEIGVLAVALATVVLQPAVRDEIYEISARSDLVGHGVATALLAPLPRRRELLTAAVHRFIASYGKDNFSGVEVSRLVDAVRGRPEDVALVRAAIGLYLGVNPADRWWFAPLALRLDPGESFDTDLAAVLEASVLDPRMGVELARSGVASQDQLATLRERIGELDRRVDAYAEQQYSYRRLRLELDWHLSQIIWDERQGGVMRVIPDSAQLLDAVRDRLPWDPEAAARAFEDRRLEPLRGQAELAVLARAAEDSQVLIAVVEAVRSDWGRVRLAEFLVRLAVAAGRDPHVEQLVVRWYEAIRPRLERRPGASLVHAALYLSPDLDDQPHELDLLASIAPHADVTSLDAVLLLTAKRLPKATRSLAQERVRTGGRAAEHLAWILSASRPSAVIAISHVDGRGRLSAARHMMVRLQEAPRCAVDAEWLLEGVRRIDRHSWGVLMSRVVMANLGWVPLGNPRCVSAAAAGAAELLSRDCGREGVVVHVGASIEDWASSDLESLRGAAAFGARKLAAAEDERRMVATAAGRARASTARPE